MTKKEINSWRLIIATLVNYGLYDLLENEIAIVASCLAREEENEKLKKEIEYLKGHTKVIGRVGGMTSE